MVMNTFPIIEMLALYCRSRRLEKPTWRTASTRHLHRVRSCHSKTDGGVRKSYYSIETKCGEIFDLIYNEEELIWSLDPSDRYPDHEVDNVLALVKRHKHTPSRAHRIIPYRFEVIPKSHIQNKDGRPVPPLVQRVEPFRFQSGKIPSSQIIDIVTRHVENVMVTKHLHYVVETDQHRYFHIVYILDESDWRLMNEVDEQFFFVK